MISPWLIGGGIAGAGLLGYGLMRKIKLKGTPTKNPGATTVLSDGKEVPTIDLKTLPGYTAGFAAGRADGYTDGLAGASSNPRPILNYSTDPQEQAAYALGYDAGYAEGRDAGLAFKSFTTDSTGATDDTKTVVAKEKEKVGTDADRIKGTNDGQSDGYYAGNKDEQDGIGDPSGSSSSRYHNLRNAVAGLGRSDAYKAGYVMGLDSGYSRGYNDALHGVTVGAFRGCRKCANSGVRPVSALATPGVGKLGPRAPVWQGGTRSVGAMSRAGQSYAGSPTQVGGI